MVCADSALYSSQPAGAPTQMVNNDNGNYAHTTAAWGIGTKLIMACDSWESTPINNPVRGDLLFTKIMEVINGTAN